MKPLQQTRFLALLIALSAISLTSASAFPVSVKDVRGKTIVIKSAPKRIVSLTPSNTEMLFALGLQDRIVGVTTWCNYPSAAKKKTKIGDRSVNVEKVISLKPDLIVAHAKLNGEYVERFEKLGKTVIAVDPKTYSQVISDVLMLGRATGSGSRASVIAKNMRSSLSRAKTAGSKGSKPNVLVVIQPNPLWAAGPDTLVDEMLGYVGAKNIAHDGKTGFNQFPVETAISRRPDVLIVGKGEKKFFASSPVWKGSKAVKNGRVYEVDFDLLVRPGPRLAQGLNELAKLLK